MRIAAIVLTAVGIFLSLPSLAEAQKVAACSDWNAVSKFQVNITVVGTGQWTDENGATHTDNESTTITGVVPAQGVSGVCEQTPTIVGWQGDATQIQYSVNLNDRTDTTCTYTDISTLPYTITTYPYVITYTVSKGTYFARAASLILDFTDPANPIAKFSFPQSVDGVLVSFEPDSSCNDEKAGTSTVQFPWGPGLEPFENVGFALPSTVSPITGSSTFQSLGFVIPSPYVSWTVNWNFTPVQPDFDLIVSIPDYQTWRPIAGQKETDPGIDPDTGAGLLEIDAQLMDKNTGAVSTVVPDKVSFVLAAVSHEPGVAMNWPPEGTATTGPDMTFDAALNPGAKVDPTGTIAEFTPTEASTYNMYLTSHDWGGWATLNVTAMVGGTEVKGHLQLPPPALSNPSATDILIPQRQSGSFIADNWKAAHNIPLSTADTDDQEKTPNGNPAYVGDGLTLYEEYRGFDVPECNGCTQLIHYEGDPLKKDLFVINTVGRPEVTSGIKLYQSRTGTRVCCPNLTENQINSDRVINFNHASGPTEVPQHALLMVDGKPGSSSCAYGPSFEPGTPQAITKIFIPALADLQGVAEAVRSSGKIPTGTKSTAASTVAHELGHASSVWHHGEDGGSDVFWYTPDGVQVKEIARGSSPATAQALVNTGGGAAIRVFTEGNVQLHAADLNLTVGSPPTDLYQGIFNGAHSGDVLCFMRYDMSTNYIAQQDSSKRYWAIENSGFSLTNTTTGTGPNKSGHKPQSRYGSSQTSPARGDCVTQFCINDFVTPTPRGSGGGDCSKEQQ